jgi:hypothetical protein
MLQKMEHVFSESDFLIVKDIHLALEVNTFLCKLYANDGSQYRVQPLAVWTSDSHRQHHRKGEEDHLHTR